MSEYFWKTVKKILVKLSLKIDKDEINDLRCGICGNIMVNAAQIICGCRFCRLCIEFFLSNGGRMCPVNEDDQCHSVILRGIDDVHEEKGCNVSILSLITRCPSEGCLYEADIESIVSHLKECEEGNFIKENFHESVQTGVITHPSENVLYNGKIDNIEKEDNVSTEDSPKSRHKKSNGSENLEDLKLMITSLKSKNKKLEKSLQEMSVRISDLEKSQINSNLNTSYLFRTVNSLEEQFEESKYESFVWTINNFKKLKSKNDYIYSKPFYIFKNGYKLRILLYPNGCYNTLFLSIYFEIMRGEYDLLLKWPFCYNVTFTLLNQDNGKNFEHTVYYVHHKHREYVYGRPTSPTNVGLGITEFIKLNHLDSNSFIVNDSIIFVCSMSKSPQSISYED